MSADQIARIRAAVDLHKEPHFRSAEWLADEVQRILDSEPANDTAGNRKHLVTRLHYAAGSDRLRQDWRTQKLLSEAARAISALLSDMVEHFDKRGVPPEVGHHYREADRILGDGL